MPEKKRFLLRLDPGVYAALEHWAADEFRSANGQIEFLLRDALRRAGRLKKRSDETAPGPSDDELPGSSSS